MMMIRNRLSGKYFIALEEETDNDATILLITPVGLVKRLEKRLFGKVDFVDPQDPACSKLLTEAQFKKYEEYLDTFSPRN